MMLIHCHLPLKSQNMQILDLLAARHYILLREQAILSLLDPDFSVKLEAYKNLLILKNDAEGLGVSKQLNSEIPQITDGEFVELCLISDKTIGWS